MAPCKPPAAPGCCCWGPTRYQPSARCQGSRPPEAEGCRGESVLACFGHSLHADCRSELLTVLLEPAFHQQTEFLARPKAGYGVCSLVALLVGLLSPSRPLSHLPHAPQTSRGTRLPKLTRFLLPGCLCPSAALTSHGAPSWCHPAPLCSHGTSHSTETPVLSPPAFRGGHFQEKLCIPAKRLSSRHLFFCPS